jgi:ferredoxin
LARSRPGRPLLSSDRLREQRRQLGGGLEPVASFRRVGDPDSLGKQLQHARTPDLATLNAIDEGAVPTAPLTTTAAPAVKVSVDNNHCGLYGICQQEAPEVFELGVDGRLRYEAAPSTDHTPAVRQAARCCPMQAITLTKEPK